MNGRSHARGVALLEALVAAVIALAAMGAAVHLAVGLRLSAGAESDHVDALRVAEGTLDAARGQPVPALAPGEPATTTATWPRDAGDATLGEVRVRQTLQADAAARDLAWVDVTADPGDARRGPRPLTLHSALDRAAAALAGAVVVDRAAPSWRVEGHAVTLPADARPLAAGRHLWRPDPARPAEFVFDDATGRIVARCADAALPDACVPTDALLLSGTIRASTGATPDPVSPPDAPPPLAVRLALDRGTLLPPGCVVRPDTATALAYHCAIAPEGGAWSGRSEIVPIGWRVATAADARRVCRYVAPIGVAPSAAQRQAAHPARYDDVDRPLMHQNFLIVRGDAACPVADGIATEAHQP